MIFTSTSPDIANHSACGARCRQLAKPDVDRASLEAAAGLFQIELA